MFKWSVSCALAFLLLGCGGGGGNSPPPVTTIPVVNASNNAKIGDGFIYADGEWKLSGDYIHKWVLRGTTETASFGPYSWYQPSGGLQNVQPWWSVGNTVKGLTMSSSPPASNLYNASFANDVLTDSIYVRNKPFVYVDTNITFFSGDKARAAIGLSMQYPNGDSYFLERNIKLSPSFDLCPDVRYQRCQTNITYFPPADGPIDVRSLLLNSPDMTVEKVDSLRIIGVYIGSEIYGEGRVDMTISKYEIK